MIPTADDLKSFIRDNQPVNLSKIAREFNIRAATASELVRALEEQREAIVEKTAGSKFVKLMP